MKALHYHAFAAGAAAALWLLLSFPRPAGGDSRASGTSLDPTPIFAGINRIVSTGAPGPLFALRPDVIPIVSGDEDTPVPSSFMLVAQHGLGRVLAMGHDGLITNSDIGFLDNRQFARQAIEWLDPSHRHALGVTSGHGETMRDNWSDSLRASMTAVGWSAAPLPGLIDSAALAPYSVVLVSNAAGLPPTAAERAALLAFVNAGGGLLLQGLGWGWAAYQGPLDEYPMNKIGAMFGIRWIDGSIDDPTDRYEGSTLFHTFYPDLPAPASTAEALEIILSTGVAHFADLAATLEADAALRSLYTRAHMFVVAAERAIPLDAPERVDLYLGFRDALENSGPSFRRVLPYDRTLFPAMAWLRERAARTLADAAPLTPGRVAEIAGTLVLSGAYEHLWTAHHLLVLDNLGLDPAQLAHLEALMDSVPATMHDLRSISVRDFLGDTNPPVSLDGVGAGGVNIFGAPIGAGMENQFPPDAAEPGWADLFCVVTAHEVNHVVDAYLARTKPDFRAFRDSCIARAGPDPMHYLRSMGNWGGFIDSPVEFFAGTSGQWFTDSWLTVRLGISRFESGLPWPIDQAYLFVNAYSNGDPYTRFYHDDPEGHFTMERVPVIRDGQGRITELRYHEHLVHFELGEDGHVTSVSLGVVATLLSQFVADAVEGGIALRWRFGNPASVVTSRVERADSGNGPWTRVEGEIRAEDGALSMVDRNVEPGHLYYYRLAGLFSDGREMLFGPVVVTAGEVLVDFALTGLSPNPATGPVRIGFAVPRRAAVKLSVLDVQGRVTAVLVDGEVTAGRHQVVWSGERTHGDARPGIYFVRYEAAGKSSIKTVAMIR